MATDAERNRGAGAYSTPTVDHAAPTAISDINSTLPIVDFNLKQVEPPSPLYIQQADRFFLSGLNSDVNVAQLLLNGRILRASDGQVSPFNLAMNITSDRVVTRQMFDLTEGYLLGAKILGLGGTTRGRCYVSLDIARGQVANRTLYQQLIADYISRNHDATWPGGDYIHSIDGPGWAHRVAGATPAAGADVSETVPTNARYRLVSFRCQLNTSAAVANRQVRFVLDDGTTIFYSAYASNQQAANTIAVYEFVPGGPAAYSITGSSTSVDAQVPAPAGAPLFTGFRIRTVTDALQAADQFSIVSYEVEEWIEF